MAKTPTKTTKSKTKSASAEPAAVAKKAPAAPRKLKQPKYQSFKMQRRIKPTGTLPSAYRIFGGAVKVLFKHWRVFLGMVLIYGVLNLVLVRGFSGSANLTDIKNTLDGALKGDWSQAASGGLLFVYLLGSAGNSASATAGAYQLILTLITSVAFIWTLREVYQDNKVRVRDGFYVGVFPMVPFMVVLVTIGLQLLPAAAGIYAYGLVTSNGVAASGLEQVLWAVAMAVLILLSLYMICSSLFALYIVCLPGMTPLHALRSARKLVAARRWMVMRKIIFLPVALVVISGIVTIPFILYATPAAPWVIFGLTMLLLPLIHSYLYRLYRALL
ncbi:MAG TPA: hypothetical protein VLI54_03085 [Bacillota bacterium]|nr:hypothetical protein [Bacillota bacterium]